MSCPCSNLDWSGEDLTLPHHPKCEVNFIDNLLLNLERLGIPKSQTFDAAESLLGFATKCIQGNPDKNYATIHEFGVQPRRVVVALSPPPSTEQLMELAMKKLKQKAETTVAFIHCGKRTEARFTTPTYEARCSVCGEVFLSRT